VNIEQIVAELKVERDRLDKAIAAVRGVSTQPRRGRPPKAVQTSARPKHRRRMSAAGRARIAAAQRARWAKAKRAKASKPVRRLSAAARRKLSRLLKQRWAQGKMKRRAKAR